MLFHKSENLCKLLYHLRLFFSSFSTKIQAATARVATPVINPINKPNANILFTYLVIIYFLIKLNFHYVWCRDKVVSLDNHFLHIIKTDKIQVVSDVKRKDIYLIEGSFVSCLFECY